MADLERTPEEIITFLPERLVQQLGVLADRPIEEARANLGLQLFGTATLLEVSGLVSYQNYEQSALELAKDPADESAAEMVHVTELGKQVMSVCQSRLPEGEREELAKTILNTTDNRRTIVRRALLDQPHPASILVAYLHPYAA